MLVPLARACLVFNTTRVPPASLEGLAEYSHCWVIYVFHLNTDLEKLWKHPSKSGFKAKVCPCVCIALVLIDILSVWHHLFASTLGPRNLFL